MIGPKARGPYNYYGFGNYNCLNNIPETTVPSLLHFGAHGRVDTEREYHETHQKSGYIFKVQFERFGRNFSPSIPLFNVFVLFDRGFRILTTGHTASGDEKQDIQVRREISQ